MKLLYSSKSKSMLIVNITNSIWNTVMGVDVNIFSYQFLGLMYMFQKLFWIYIFAQLSYEYQTKQEATFSELWQVHHIIAGNASSYVSCYIINRLLHY